MGNALHDHVHADGALRDELGPVKADADRLVSVLDELAQTIDPVLTPRAGRLIDDAKQLAERITGAVPEMPVVATTEQYGGTEPATSELDSDTETTPDE